MNMKKTILIGETKDEVVTLNIEIREDNEFSMSGSSYDREAITDQEGEDKARETLEDMDYWDGLGMIDQKCFLTGYIDWEDYWKKFHLKKLNDEQVKEIKTLCECRDSDINDLIQLRINQGLNIIDGNKED
jgi:hypothetical protein